jgi:hypothetical protein
MFHATPASIAVASGNWPGVGGQVHPSEAHPRSRLLRHHRGASSLYGMSVVLPGFMFSMIAGPTGPAEAGRPYAEGSGRFSSPGMATATR